MAITPTKQTAPSYSTLHAKKDAVLVCTTKNGTDERFKYIGIEEVQYNGKPLQEIFDGINKYYEETGKTIAELKAQVAAMQESQDKFIEILKGGSI